MKWLSRGINILLNKDPDSKFHGSTRLNIIQVVVVIVLVPICAVVFGAISSNGGFTAHTAQILASLIANVPLLSTCMDLISQTIGMGMNLGDLLTADVLLFLKAFPDAILSILCVRFFTALFDRIKPNALHIFAAFFGIFAATLITTLTGLNKDMVKVILMEFGVIIIVLIGMFILFRSVFHYSAVSKVKIVLLYIIDGLLTVYTTTYSAAFFLVFQGFYTSSGRAFALLAGMGVVEVILGIVVFFVHQGVDSDVRG